MNAYPRPRLFALLWLVAGLGVVLLSIVLSVVAVTGIRWVAEQIAGVPIYDFWDGNFALLLSLSGAISGCCVGVLQQLIVARALRVKLSGWWRASTLGGLLGGLACWLLIEPLDYFGWLWSLNLAPAQYSALHYNLPALLFVVCLASLQARMLLRHASGAGTWLAAHALAILLTTGIGFSLLDPWAISDSLSGTIRFLSSFCLLTIFTGIAMHRFVVARVAPQEKSKRKAQAPDMA